MLLCPFSNFSTVVSHGVGVALLSFKKRETDAAIEETKLIAMQHRGGGRCCYIRAGFPCSLFRPHPLFKAPVPTIASCCMSLSTFPACVNPMVFYFIFLLSSPRDQGFHFSSGNSFAHRLSNDTVRILCNSSGSNLLRT